MLDIQLLRSNLSFVAERLALRGVTLDTAAFEALEAERKRLQVEHAAHASPNAKLVKLADKISNLRDIAASPPASWSLTRQQDYFEWAKAVIDGVRGADAKLEAAFDEAYARKPR